MSSAVLSRIPDAVEVAALDAQQVVQLLRLQAEVNEASRNQIEALRAQLEWFKRQVFGQKRERYPVLSDAQQMHLGDMMPITERAVEEGAPAHIRGHIRRMPRSDSTDDAASVPLFDDSKVSVLNIEVPNLGVQDQAPDQYEVVGQQVCHLLAQRPGAYLVPKYVRQVIKRLDTRTLQCAPAPGRLCEVACRVTMLRLQDDGLIQLPPSQIRRPRQRACFVSTALSDPQSAITAAGHQLAPLQIASLQIASCRGEAPIPGCGARQ
jgi:hypothetical protein